MNGWRLASSRAALSSWALLWTANAGRGLADERGPSVDLLVVRRDEEIEKGDVPCLVGVVAADMLQIHLV